MDPGRGEKSQIWSLEFVVYQICRKLFFAYWLSLLWLYLMSPENVSNVALSSVPKNYCTAQLGSELITFSNNPLMSGNSPENLVFTVSQTLNGLQRFY